MMGVMKGGDFLPQGKRFDWILETFGERHLTPSRSAFSKPSRSLSRERHRERHRAHLTVFCNERGAKLSSPEC